MHTLEPGNLEAVITSATPDPASHNNRATLTVQLAPAADLTIGMVVPAGGISVQGLVNFSIWVTNFGPSEARQVRVAQLLPDGITYLGVGVEGRPPSPDPPSTGRWEGSPRDRSPMPPSLPAPSGLAAMRFVPRRFPNSQIQFSPTTLAKACSGSLRFRRTVTDAIFRRTRTRPPWWCASPTRPAVGSQWITPPEVERRRQATFLHRAGRLEFAPGIREMSVKIPILEDSLNEATEQFTLELTAALNATIAKPRGTITILDNDPFPAISVRDISLPEGSSDQRCPLRSDVDPIERPDCAGALCHGKRNCSGRGRLPRAGRCTSTFPQG